MGLEASYLAGAIVLLVILIFGVASYRKRNRAYDEVREQATRDLYGQEKPDTRTQQTLHGPRAMNGVEPDRSEDDIQREQLGPRGVPGAPDPAKMTEQRRKKTPTNVGQGHVS